MLPRTLAVTLLCFAFFGGVLHGLSQEPTPVRPGHGYKMPVLVSSVKPVYTQEALREKIQGEVALEVVVNADGTVGHPRVVKSLDRQFGLDDQAVVAALKWKFKPAVDPDGHPVAMFVVLELDFWLPKGTST